MKGRNQLQLLLLLQFFIFILFSSTVRAFNYSDALTKSLLYFETQRSGRLPYYQRVTWRSDSGLTDGLQQGVDLVGGYYDAGDNVKFGLPMAFTMTMLSWNVIEYGEQIEAIGADEYKHALQAIKWGTDYLIKTHSSPNVLWVQVGDGDTDHYCWQRPEDMTTPRRAYKVDEKNPGSEVAGETAAAMAAASIVFQNSDPHYSRLLLLHATQVFEFGNKYRGKYHHSVAAAKNYYTSVSGYKDELLWGALWLYKATGNEDYFKYIIQNAQSFGGIGWEIKEFSWDVKYAGVQIIASMLMDEAETEEQMAVLEQYRSKAEIYLCACLNKTQNFNVDRTPGGLLYIREWNNMQYVSTAVFLLTVYSDHLQSSNQKLHCQRGIVEPHEMLSFAKSQVDYILGSNPMGMSYLVGFGLRFPLRVHHRGSSIVSYRQNKDFIGCTQGYHYWFGRKGANPNVLVGALVGGPDPHDHFKDRRDDYGQSEACTYNTAPLVGIFAKLHHLEQQTDHINQSTACSSVYI